MYCASTGSWAAVRGGQLEFVVGLLACVDGDGVFHELRVLGVEVGAVVLAGLEAQAGEEEGGDVGVVHAGGLA